MSACQGLAWFLECGESSSSGGSAMIHGQPSSLCPRDHLWNPARSWMVPEAVGIEYDLNST